MASSKDTYKVTLYSAVGTALTTFGVQAANQDDAKRETRKWLEAHAYAVRAISFSADRPFAIVAYATPLAKK